MLLIFSFCIVVFIIRFHSYIGDNALRFISSFSMRDRDRDLWCIGAGRFLSHSEDFESSLHSLSIQRLDALIYIEGKSWR